VNVSTSTFVGGTRNDVYPVPNNFIPTLIAGSGNAILAVPFGEEGVTYRSAVVCQDDCTFSNQSTISSGLLSRSYTVTYRVDLGGGSYGTATPDSTSIGKPPYVVYLDAINGVRAIGFDAGGSEFTMIPAGGFAGVPVDVSATVIP
jgi:hypothetical protein